MSLLADEMNAYVEKSQGIYKNVHRINKWVQQIDRYKINTQKLIAFLY